MIRLACTILEKPIEFYENKVNVLILENQKYFRNFIEELVKSSKNEESCINLSKNYEDISFTKYLDLIIDVLSIDPNNKKVLTKIYDELQAIAINENFYLKTLELQGMIDQYAERLLDHSMCPLRFSKTSISSVLKMLYIKFDGCGDSLLTLLCDYINVMNEFCNLKIFCFVHLKSYLTEGELLDLYQHAHYKKIHLFLIESTEKKKLIDEIITLIDIDLCTIT